MYSFWLFPFLQIKPINQIPLQQCTVRAEMTNIFEEEVKTTRFMYFEPMEWSSVEFGCFCLWISSLVSVSAFFHCMMCTSPEARDRCRLVFLFLPPAGITQWMQTTRDKQLLEKMKRCPVWRSLVALTFVLVFSNLTHKQDWLDSAVVKSHPALLLDLHIFPDRV